MTKARLLTSPLAILTLYLSGCTAAAVTDVTPTEFKRTANQSGAVAVFFDTEWCQPCIEMGLLLDSLAPEYSGRLRIYHIDAEADPKLSKELNVDLIPQIRVYRNGKLVHRILGGGDQEWLEWELDRALAGKGDAHVPSDICGCGCTHSPECCVPPKPLPELSVEQWELMKSLPLTKPTTTPSTTDDVIIPDFGPPVSPCKCATASLPAWMFYQHKPKIP